SDEQGVRNLLARYAHTLDARAADDFAALFADNAVFTVPGRTFEGSAGARSFAAALKDSPPGKHVTINSALAREADGSYTAVSDFMLLKREGQAWSVGLVWHYHDVLVRNAAGRWQFQKREIRFA